MGGGGLALRVAATWALARAGFSDTELGAGVQGRVLGVADMDGDGTLDVVTASADRFTVVYNTAEGFIWQFDGDMTAPLILRWQTSGNSGAGCLDVLNFNGDGDPDFFAGRPEENLLSSYRRLGDDFVEGVVDNDAGGVVALVHADVNGDGDVDAFAAYGALNAVAYLKNDGAGNEASFSRVLGTEDGMAPNAIFGNVDVDGDGNLDLLGVDVDGDGDVDVLVASYFDDAVTWFENQGEDAAGTLQFAQHAVKSTSYARGLVEQVTGTWGDICLDETSSAVATDVPSASSSTASSGALGTSEALPDSSGAFAGLDCYSTSIFSDGASAGADITYKLCLDGAVLAADAVSLDAAETLTDGEYGSTSDPVFLDFPSPTAPTLVARYAFDGGDASDDSGNGMTGTIHGATATVGFDGGGALAFDGVDDYVELPAAVTATLGAGAARTVCLWAKIGAFDGGGLFSYGAPADGREFSLRTYGDVVLRVQYYGEAFDADVALAGSDDGAWHHYCLAYDGAAWTLYYDGSQAQTATLALDTDAASATFKLGPLRDDARADAVARADADAAADARVRGDARRVLPFDDGTAADDVTGGLALDGTITGATATAGPGGSRALAFDGVDDIATFPAAVTADVLLASSRTFCLWATVDAWNGAALFSYGAADHWDDTTYFAFQTSHEPGEFKLSFQSSNVVLWGSDDGAWHHYCVTYDDGWLKLYFDGEFFDSSVAYLHTGDGQNFMVGGAGSDAAYFDGAVDDLYVYSSALDAASIQHIFELTGLPTASPTLTPPPTRVSQSTLVGYYSFDDGTAAEDTDSSLNGTVFGATATTGPDGSGALSFDGSESAAAFPTALTWGLLGIAHRTVCLWATIDAWNGAALFWYGTLWSASDNQVFALKTSSPGSVDVYFNGAADAGDVALAGSDDGAWHHYCVAYDGAFWFLYFDGQQASTGAAELNTGDEFELQVGGLSNWGVYFDGAVDDLYVYSSALDAASIQHIFELTGTPTAAPTLTPPPPPSNGELCDCTSYANGATEYDAVLCVPNSGQCRPPNDGDGLCSSDAPACVLSDAPTPHPTSLFSTLAPTPASLYYDCRRMTNTICDDDLMDMCVVGPRDCGDLDEETCFYEDCNPCAAGAGDAMCACGILSVYGDYTNLCCWGGCGECGGQACDERPGGPDKCCHSNINSSGDICQVPSDTACAVPDPLDDTTIRVAVAAWAWGPETATATYGDIGSWDTSMVTDFSELFCASADDCGHTYAEAATFDEDVGYWDVCPRR
ncbi:hypothetical protein JL722_8336 [Aureococcus anophagefferens]|nr:hypothetical protein JL722_8336 [Aureococcus anophagefferens]